MALTSVEKAILRAPQRGSVFLAVAAVLWIALREGNRRFYRATALLYEDEPEAAMIELPGGG
jgi:hypothetical protein